MGRSSADFSDDEFRALLAALQRFSETDLDQFVHWRIPTTWGEVYVTISNGPGPGATAEAFDAVWPDMPLGGS